MGAKDVVWRGIMHAKIWVSDNKRGYIGSANTDWKSLAQVKELGARLDADGGASYAVYELSKLFDVFWEWADPSFPIQKGVSAYSRTFQATLTVAPWEYLVPEADRDQPLRHA